MKIRPDFSGLAWGCLLFVASAVAAFVGWLVVVIGGLP